LVTLKEEILQKQYERNLARRATLASPSRLALRAKKEKTSEELERLRREWRAAQEALHHEEAAIKVLEEQLAIYALSIAAYWLNAQK
jgi:hypothetical protein